MKKFANTLILLALISLALLNIGGTLIFGVVPESTPPPGADVDNAISVGTGVMYSIADEIHFKYKGGTYDVYYAPGRNHIKKIARSTSSDNKFIVLIQGRIHVLTIKFEGEKTTILKDSTIEILDTGTEGEVFDQVKGDALYGIASGLVFKTSDGVSWSVDTLGLNISSPFSFFPNDLEMDTSQNVYLNCNKGIYFQDADSATWHSVASPNGRVGTIFVDRLNRLVFSAFGVWLSTDGGASWSVDSAGIGTTNLYGFADDAFGNLYAWTPSAIYKSPAGTGTWTQINQGITAITVNSPVINSVSGDSILSAATSFGLYLSTDQGATWTEANNGIPATVHNLFKLNNGGYACNTDLGIYARAPFDTAWTKSYPASGYQSGLNLFHDYQGSLYTILAGPPGSNELGTTLKSTDNGVTWNPDTLGEAQIKSGVFFVDRTGVEHTASNALQGMVYQKSPGGSWTPDTAGLAYSYASTASSMCSDGQSWLYVTGSLRATSAPNTSIPIFRRPLLGGTWLPDTLGKVASPKSFSSGFTAMAADNKGNVFGSTGSYLFVRKDSAWTYIPPPSFTPTPTGYVISAISVDSNNNFIVAFQSISLSLGQPVQYDQGVYFTPDLGVTWNFSGLADSGITALSSSGDSTFATGPSQTYLLTPGGAPTPTSVYALNDKWNLVSVPQHVADPKVTTLFPTAQSSAFAYQRGYVTADSLYPGTGYWLKFSGAQSDTIAGTSVTTDTIQMALGWNIFGAVATPTPTASIGLIPTGTWVISQFFAYDNGYSAVDTLMPGQGYWVKTDTAGSFAFTGGSSATKKPSARAQLKEMDELTFADAQGRKQPLYLSRASIDRQDLFELPPPPPAGSFDARFSNGLMVENASQSSAFAVSVTGAKFPLTIKWSSRAPERDLQVIVDGKSSSVASGASRKITVPFKQLSVELGGASQIPTAFALRENYPNPFNPATRIQYDLPVDSHVALKIYNILGQTVATLVNESETAGYKNVDWNAQSFASGLYFYHIETSSVADPSKTFSATNKMLLVK
jgi:hypothetical protein